MHLKGGVPASESQFGFVGAEQRLATVLIFSHSSSIPAPLGFFAREEWEGGSRFKVQGSRFDSIL